MPIVSTGDTQISYDQRGAGEPLLLINGFASSSATWGPAFLEGLARSFRLITFDNRGTGRSDTRDEPVTLARLADDGVAVLDALGVARAHVMGISMGGMIAQELALRHPERVLGLVLGCTNVGVPLSQVASQETLALLFPPAGVDPREAARYAWRVGYTDAFIAANQALLESVLDRALEHPTPLFTRMRQSEAVREWQSHDRLGGLTAPTLIITGDRDILVPPENSQILHERIAGSRLEVIKDAAHVFPSSHPEETVGLVTEFLQAVRAPAAAGGV